MALPTMPSGWATRKTFQESLIRRRESEAALRDSALRNHNYFRKASIAVDKQNEWTSMASFKDSMTAYSKKTVAEEKVESLRRRRDRLRSLLRTEAAMFEEQLKGVTSPETHLKIEEMREKVEAIRSAREEKRQKTAEERLVDHFRQNNPELRALKHDYNRKKTVLTWKDQVEEAKVKKEEERLKKEEEEAELERKRKAAETLAAKEEAMKRMMEERAREALKRQVEELRIREATSRKLKEEEEELITQRAELAEMKAAREAVEKQRRERAYRQALLRQHKAALRRHAQEVQKELEDDMKILTKIAEREDEEKEMISSRREKAKADVQWMRDVLAEQMELEQDREAELEAMYQEEAARVWQKREAEWERERIAREKLMEEVFRVREEQLDVKVATVRKQRQEALRERQEILKDVEIADQMAREQVEEAELTKQLTRRDIESQRDERVERLQLQKLREREEEDAEEKQRRDYEEMLNEEARRFRIDSDEEGEEEEDRTSKRIESPSSEQGSVASSARSRASVRSNPPWATHDDLPERQVNGNGRRKTAWS